MNPAGSAGDLKKIAAVVTTAPTPVTNMTGFLASTIGLSFLNESPMAGIRISEVRIERFLAVMDVAPSVQFGRPDHLEVLDNRSQRPDRKERQRADDQDGPGQDD